MKKQNFILKYKLATYKAMMIIVIMILLFSHSPSEIKPSHAMRTSLVYQVGEKPVNDLANRWLMNFNKNKKETTTLKEVVILIVCFIVVMMYLIIVGGSKGKSQAEQRLEDEEQIEYLRNYKSKKERYVEVINGKSLY